MLITCVYLICDKNREGASLTIVTPLGSIVDSLLPIVLGMRGCWGVLRVHDG